MVYPIFKKGEIAMWNHVLDEIKKEREEDQKKK